MGLFEVYATTSVALAIAIPTFFEKVMRPGYEKRVEKFRRNSLEEFKQSLNEVVGILYRESELTEEIVEKMKSVLESWDMVRTNDKKFEESIVKRNYIALSWLFVFVLTVFSMSFQEFNNILNFDLAKITTLIFFMTLIFTIVYVKSLLDFDKDLSCIVTEEGKLKKEKRQTKFSDGFSDLLKLELDTVSHINDALKDNAIPFEREIKGKRFNYDFVLPGSEMPKIFIEVKPLREKSSLFPLVHADSIIRKSVFSKRDYPQSKFILFSNNKENFLTPQTEEMLRYDVDKIFDLKDMKEFIIYLKEELKD
jgi:hypothetical protein